MGILNLTKYNTAHDPTIKNRWNKEKEKESDNILKNVFKKIKNGNPFKTKYKNITNTEGNTLLHLACYENNVEIVRFLLKNGADINKEDKNGFTPLYLACYENNVEIVRLLLEKDADINKEDKDGNTPLHVACYENNVEIVRLLLEKDADINKEDKDGITPLHVAIKYKNNEIIEEIDKKMPTITSSNIYKKMEEMEKEEKQKEEKQKIEKEEKQKIEKQKEKEKEEITSIKIWSYIKDTNFSIRLKVTNTIRYVFRHDNYLETPTNDISYYITMYTGMPEDIRPVNQSDELIKRIITDEFYMRKIYTATINNRNSTQYVDKLSNQAKDEFNKLINNGKLINASFTLPVYLSFKLPELVEKKRFVDTEGYKYTSMRDWLEKSLPSGYTNIDRIKTLKFNTPENILDNLEYLDNFVQGVMVEYVKKVDTTITDIYNMASNQKLTIENALKYKFDQIISSTITSNQPSYNENMLIMLLKRYITTYYTYNNNKIVEIGS